MRRRSGQAPHRNAAQNRKLWALVGDLQRLGLSREDATEALRDQVERVAGHRHTSQLTAPQAAEVIDALDGQVRGRRDASPDEEPAREPWGPRGPGPRKGQTITPDQQRVLRDLFRQAGMGTPEQQRAFTKRQTGKPWPQTQRDCDAIFEALKAIILRDLDPGVAHARCMALRGHPALDAWKRGFIDDLCEQYERAEDPSKVMTTHKLDKLVEAEAWVRARTEGVA